MSDSKTPTISIEGKATVSAKSDIGFVDLYTRADGMLLEDAIAESSSRAERIVGGITSSNLDIKSISVTDVQIGERKPMLPSSKESPKPEVIKNILVIPPSPGTAILIVDIASRLGASLQNPLGNMFGGGLAGSAIVYGLVDYSEIEAAAMKAAIKDAQTMASRMAKLLGKSVGRILEVAKVGTAGSGTSLPGVLRKTKDSKFSTEYLSLSPDKIEVTASLTMVFELLDGQNAMT